MAITQWIVDIIQVYVYIIVYLIDNQVNINKQIFELVINIIKGRNKMQLSLSSSTSSKQSQQRCSQRAQNSKSIFFRVGKKALDYTISNNAKYRERQRQNIFKSYQHNQNMKLSTSKLTDEQVHNSQIYSRLVEQIKQMQIKTEEHQNQHRNSMQAVEAHIGRAKEMIHGCKYNVWELKNQIISLEEELADQLQQMHELQAQIQDMEQEQYQQQLQGQRNEEYQNDCLEPYSNIEAYLNCQNDGDQHQDSQKSIQKDILNEASRSNQDNNQQQQQQQQQSEWQFQSRRGNELNFGAPDSHRLYPHDNQYIKQTNLNLQVLSDV